MVILFNKAKIYSYLVALTTVVVLFAVASNIDSEDIAIQASSTNNDIKIENIINTIIE